MLEGKCPVRYNILTARLVSEVNKMTSFCTILYFFPALDLLAKSRMNAFHLQEDLHGFQKV